MIAPRERWLPLGRAWLWLQGRPARVQVVIAVAFVITRIVIWRSHPLGLSFSDSNEYRHQPGAPEYPTLSLAGHAVRPPTVPYFFSLLPDDAAIVAAQVLVSTVSWLVLAGTVSSMLRDRRLKVLAFGGVVLFGASIGVMNWDLTILSESLSISLAALTLAMWCRFLRSPVWGNAAAAVIPSVLLAYARTQLVPQLVVLGVAMVIRGIRQVRAGRSAHGETRLPRVPRDAAIACTMAAVLLAAAGWGAVITKNVEDAGVGRREGVGPFAQNFALVLDARIMPDDDTYAWFLDQGMPRPVTLEAIDRTTSTPDAPLRALAADPQLLAWVESRGASALMQYSVVHPEELPMLFFREAPDILVPDRPLIVYGQLTGALPSQIDAFLTPTAQDWGFVLPPVLLLAMAMTLAKLLPYRRPVDRQARAALVASLAMSVGGFYLSWLASPLEPPRHAIPFTTILPVSLMVGTFLYLDAWIPSRPFVLDWSVKLRSRRATGAGERV